MSNCSIETKRKVVSLYHKGYSLFSISMATSVPTSTCWHIIRRYNSHGHFKNRKSAGRPKNLDSKQEKQLINLSQNDTKKIQLNFYGISIEKKLLHKFDTENIKTETDKIIQEMEITHQTNSSKFCQ